MQTPTRVDLGEVAAAAAEQLEPQFEATGVDLDVRLARPSSSPAIPSGSTRWSSTS